MTENELLKQSIKEHYFDKEQIRQRVMASFPASRRNTGGVTYMKKRLSLVAIAAVIICLSAITTFALNRFLTPKQAADKLVEPNAAAAFDREGALTLNESVTEAGYTVTFLGVTTGENLDLSEVKRDKTYAVVAIALADGSPMNDQTAIPFFVSPLVKGLNPGLYNIAFMNGSYSENIIDGIFYRIIECDSVEMFADRGLYLCVTQSQFYNADAYVVDSSTGAITPNPDFSGLHVLFTLPLDPAKADAQKAQAYIDSVFEPKNDNVATFPSDVDDKSDVVVVMTESTPIEASRKMLSPDTTGKLIYTYETPNDGSVNATLTDDQIEQFAPGEAFIYSEYSSGDGKTIKTWYLILTKQENGMVEAVIYELIK